MSIYLNNNIYEFSLYSLENNILPHLWISSDGIIIYANKISECVFNTYPLLNTYVYRIASDISKNDWRKLWISLLKNKSITFLHKFYNKEKDMVLSLKIYCNLFIFNNIKYCQMVIVDDTELVETNLKLSKEKQKYQEIDKLKFAFLSNLSHEIRTPMNAIVGFSDILGNITTDESIKDYTKIIVDNVEYLLSFIENIITISRMDSNQIKIKLDDFNILDMLNNIKFLYDNEIEKKQLNIRIIIDNKNEYSINSDKYIIEECLKILLDNAIKFTKEGKINIGYIINDNKISFYVKDTGIGIDNKYHDIIFDKFRQINKTVKGAGLGLSIFKLYVKLLGGSFDIKSKLNNGSIFSFTIDTMKSNKLKISYDESTIDFLKNKKIMIVEDLEVNQLLINDTLNPYGVDIVKCFNGKECIEKFNEIKNIDLILMDLDMPEMNGYETTKIIKKLNKTIPIIAQTAYSLKEDRERAKKFGFNDFITKPIKKLDLIKILLKYL